MRISGIAEMSSQMHSDLAVSAEHVTKTYRIFGHAADRIKQALTFGQVRFHKQFTALNDVSFEISRGESIGIIGRNGSGKSTLLQLICGILKPTFGTISVKGRILALLELGAGFNPEFTGRENVYFQGALMGYTRSEMEKRLDEIISFADIGDFIDQPVRTYSSGMYVRLAFSVAIHVEPDILVVDEALGVGDAAFTRKCFQFLREFRAKGTVIVVSHDLQLIATLCERVLWLDHGTMQAFGPVKTVCERYLSSMFGGARESFEPRTSNEDRDWVDQRLPFLNASNLRNDLEVFRFDPATPSFGGGGANIVDVVMMDESRRPCNWVIGGEMVILTIRAGVTKELNPAIVGFVVKDRFGQALFGDNTFLTYASHPIAAAAGDVLEARFRFRMPRLPVGEYAIAAAVAKGDPEAHEFQHWVHTALVFHSRRSSVDGTLVGLPMQEISLETVPSTAN
jgi:lipopolysaccharide transport system ATP-binding protein